MVANSTQHVFAAFQEKAFRLDFPYGTHTHIYIQYVII